jgi:hypothetical protein
MPSAWFGNYPEDVEQGWILFVGKQALARGPTVTIDFKVLDPAQQI